MRYFEENERGASALIMDDEHRGTWFVKAQHINAKNRSRTMEWRDIPITTNWARVLITLEECKRIVARQVGQPDLFRPQAERTHDHTIASPQAAHPRHDDAGDGDVR